MVSREEVELLLKTQQSCFNDTVNHLVSSLNDQIAKLSTDLERTKSELAIVKQDSDNKQKVIEELTSKIDDLEVVVEGNRFDSKPVFQRLDDLEDRSRRNNLRFTGIEEFPNENWEQTAGLVVKLAKDKLGIDSTVEIERAHRVGAKGRDRPRTIVAKFLRFGDRELVLRNSSKLKGSNIFVNEDLCEASLEKRKNQLPRLQEARRNGKIAYFRHTNLIVKDRPNHETPQEESTENSLQERLRSATAPTSSENSSTTNLATGYSAALTSARNSSAHRGRGGSNSTKAKTSRK